MKPCDFDVVVIGTGMGGATAGALIAREGFRVLLLEKNPRVGGACSFYNRQGAHVDTGAHMFSRGSRGPIGEVLSRLGAAGRVRFLRRAPMMRIRGPTFDFVGNYQGWTMPLLGLTALRQFRFQARELLPMAKRMTEPFWSGGQSIHGLYPERMEEKVLEATRNPSFFLFSSVMMCLCFVIPQRDASVGEALWCVKKAFQARDFGYPQGGAVAVPRAFLEGAEGRGARVVVNARVSRIRVGEGRVEGVETTDGDFYSTRAVVSTTSLRDTIELVGREHFPAEYVEHVNAVRGSLGAVQAKILLDKPVIREGVLVGIRDKRKDPTRPLSIEDVQNMWRDVEEGRVPEILCFYCPVPSNFDSSLAPPGKQLLTLTSACAVAGKEGADPQDQWIDAMVEAFFDIYPEARSRVVWIDRFQNRFLEQWLGKTGGPVISTAQDTSQVGPRRHPNVTPLQGLFVAGDCAGAAGIGTELACQSGIDCADLVVRALYNRIL